MAVYFFACNGRIKIGTSRRVDERLQEFTRLFGGIEVIGVIEGGLEREQVILASQEKHRLESEWFRDCPELRTWIAELLAIEPVQKKTEPQDARAVAKDENEWFWRPAAKIFGTDAGRVLHDLIDVPESTCYRYMRGDSAIPICEFRKLLHGPHGDTWLNVIMDGCKEAWWIRHQRAERICKALEAELKT